MGTEAFDCLGREEEELLLKFLDGEGSFFESRRARRLIQQSEVARAFVASIDQIGTCMQAWHSDLIRENRVPEIDLWNRISQRIDEEERIALFHGRRIAEPEYVHAGIFGGVAAWFDRQALFGRAAWGISGAVAAAALTFIFMRPSAHQLASLSAADIVRTPPRITGRSVDLNLSGSEPELFIPASMQRQLEQTYMKRAKRRAMVDSGARITHVQENFESPLNIDWMRSDGQVSLIQDAKRGSTIIWVNPRQGQNIPSSNSLRSAAPVVIERSETQSVRPVFK